MRPDRRRCITCGTVLRERQAHYCDPCFHAGIRATVERAAALAERSQQDKREREAR